MSQQGPQGEQGRAPLTTQGGGEGASSLWPQDADLFFGPIGSAAYRGYWPSDRGNGTSPLDLLSASFTPLEQKPTEATERRKFFENFERLLGMLATGKQNTVVEELYKQVKEISPLAQTQLGTNPPTGLGLHLQEVTQFAKGFYLLDDRSSRFPEIISDRHALLLAEVVAPVHDILKYLGSLKSQIAFDHEVFTAEMVKRVFPGKQVKLGSTVEILTAEDVEFIAAVIGDHENLYKELGRTNWVRSQDERERAKALFFVVDILTGAIQPMDEGGARWRIDQHQLQVRFVDLYFRHIDPVVGKTFRPEWALHAVKDLATTLDVLTGHGITIQGTEPGSTARQSLVDGALEGVRRALDADEARWEEARGTGRSSPEKFLDVDQLSRVLKVQRELDDLSSSLRTQ